MRDVNYINHFVACTLVMPNIQGPRVPCKEHELAGYEYAHKMQVFCRGYKFSCVPRCAHAICDAMAGRETEREDEIEKMLNGLQCV